jgi:putative transposase
MVTPAAHRKAVAHLRSAFDMSERRACTVIGCVRMTVRYHSRRPDDAGLRQRLRALAHERGRFGYRRLHILLRREGFLVNHKRLFRIYPTSASWFAVGADARALATRAPMLVPEWPNDRLRDELLNETLFRSPPHVRAVQEAWRTPITILHHNTHLSMPLKKIGSSDTGQVPRGVGRVSPRG